MTMKNITFDIFRKTGIETVNGKELRIKGESFGIFKNAEPNHDKNSNWYVVDFKTGLFYTKEKTQAKAIEEAKEKFDLYLEKARTEDYFNKVKAFKQAKIDADPFYYVVTSINTVNTRESIIFDTYREAQLYEAKIYFNHTNISIEKKKKTI